MRINISFDYDSPAGYRQSFGKTACDPYADFHGTEALLKVLAAHDVRATFGVVGVVALPGDPPEHCAEQIRRIAAAGHEIASHSMHHRFLPPMSSEELYADVKASKDALDACLGGREGIRGFIPPFNRPSHFPQKGAFSFSERLGMQGRGTGRQSVASLLGALKIAGYSWCRISFQNSLHAVQLKLGLNKRQSPAQPFVFRGMAAIPLHSTGFTDASIELVRQYLQTNLLVCLYAHPNQGLADPRLDSESAENLDRFLSLFQQERHSGEIAFETLGEVATQAFSK